MRKWISLLIVTAVLGIASHSYAQEVQKNQSLNGYDGGKIFEDDVQTDRLLDG